MELLSKKFWLSFAPNFHIEDKDYWNSRPELKFNNFDFKKKLIKDGYLQFFQVDNEINHSKYSDLVKKLNSNKILAIFSMLYDEFWLVQVRYKNYIEKIIGENYKLLPAFWVWQVGAGHDEAGWAPHRDRDYKSIDSEGMPLAITLWIPLTEAKPLNGCIYLVPAMWDRTYGTENDMNYDFEFSSIRALPAKPGDILFWNHAILHWGAKADKDYPESRISVAFEFQRGDITDMKDMVLDPFTMPSFETRLDLIAKQIIQYLHMYEFSSDMIEFAKSRRKNLDKK